MKRLALILALVAGTANAGTVFVAGNEEGTGIRFTDSKCDDEKTLLVYTTSKAGKVMAGCYSFMPEGLLVRWNDGEVYLYDREMLTVTDYGRSLLGGESL